MLAEHSVAYGASDRVAAGAVADAFAARLAVPLLEVEPGPALAAASEPVAALEKALAAATFAFAELDVLCPEMSSPEPEALVSTTDADVASLFAGQSKPYAFDSGAADAADSASGGAQESAAGVAQTTEDPVVVAALDGEPSGAMAEVETADVIASALVLQQTVAFVASAGADAVASASASSTTAVAATSRLASATDAAINAASAADVMPDDASGGCRGSSDATAWVAELARHAGQVLSRAAGVDTRAAVACPSCISACVAARAVGAAARAFAGSSTDDNTPAAAAAARAGTESSGSRTSPS